MKTTCKHPFFSIIISFVILTFFPPILLQAADTEETFTNPPGMQWGVLYGQDVSATDMVSLCDGYAVTGIQCESGDDCSASFMYTDISAILVKISKTGDIQYNHSLYDPLHPEYATAALGLDLVPANADGSGENGFVITGLKWQNHSYDGTDWYQRDMWLSRTDTAGNYAWDITYGMVGDDWGNGIAAVWDAVAGSYDFVLGGRQADSANQESRGWLLRSDSSGNQEWSRGYYGDLSELGPAGEVLSIEKTPDNGFILGTEHGIKKWSGTGTMVWSADFSNKYNQVRPTPADNGFIAVGTIADGGENNCYGGPCPDVILTKLDSDGNIEWQRTYGEPGKPDTGNDVIVTADSGYALVGSTQSYYTHGSRDLWLVKTDNDGNMQWDFPMGGENYDWGVSLVEESGENPGYFIAGNTLFDQDEDGDAESHMWFVKTLDSYARPVADISLTAPDPLFIYQDIIFDGSGSTDADGTIVSWDWDLGNDGTIDFTGQNPPPYQFHNPGDYTIALIVTDNHGLHGMASLTINVLGPAVQWQRTINNEKDCGNPANCRIDVKGNDIIKAVDDNGFVITGYTNFSYPQGARHDDLWLLKIFENGIFHWQQNLTQNMDVREEGLALARTLDNGYIITGEFQPNINNLQYPRLLLAKTDSAGNLEWHKRFGNDPAASYDATGHDVLALDNGNYLIGGFKKTDTYKDMWLLNVDEDGLEIPGSRIIPAISDQQANAICTSLVYDPTGGFALTGNLSNYQVPVIKTDDSLLTEWSFLWPKIGNGKSQANWITKVEDGYIIGGCVDNQMSLKKLNLAGNEEIWHKITRLGEYFSCAETGAQTLDGGFILVGTAKESIYGGNNMAAAKFDADGNLDWKKVFNNSATYDWATGVLPLDDSSLIIMGNECSYHGGYGCNLKLIKMGTYVGPTAAFDTDIRDGFIALEIQFTDMSSGGTPPYTYAWDFDNDGIIDSTEQDPAFIFDSRGTFTVRLDITDSAGLEDTFSCTDCIFTRNSGIYSSAEEVIITDFDVTDDADSEPGTYDFAMSPEGLNIETAFGFTLEAEGPDGSYPFQITFPSPYDPEMALYKLPDWEEIPYTVIDEYTIEVVLDIVDGVLDPPFVFATYYPLKTLTIAVNGSGTTDPPPGTYQYYYKNVFTVKMTAIPDSCWEFDHWEGDISGSFNPSYISFYSSSNDKSVTAFFVESPAVPGDTDEDGDVDGEDIENLVTAPDGFTLEELGILASHFGMEGCS